MRLTLSHTGQGSDPVASPANSTGCAAGQYVSGATINLSGAVPTTGWQISSWTGTNNDASTGNTNIVTMPASARTASVNYTLIPPTCYALTLSHTGQGSDPVASPANSTGCAAGQYISGATIDLSGAVPTTGWQIASWTGTDNDASTSNTNTITMPASVHASSVNYIQTGYTLTLTSAHGTIAKNPDKASYTYGESVQLTATPAGGWAFASWSGDATGTTNPVSITMDANKSVTANYVSTLKAMTLRSVAGYDGWVLESSENSNLGGTLNAGAPTFNGRRRCRQAAVSSHPVLQQRPPAGQCGHHRR